MNDQLASLLIDLSAMLEEEADQFVFEKYAELYLDQGPEQRRIGVRNAHDGQEVLFTESRYDHAFGTSREKTSRQYAKDKFDRLRGERVAWIGPVVAGQIDGTECWVMPPEDGSRDERGRTLNQRMYLVRPEGYVVWLQPSSRRNGWWFSTAYVAGFGDVRRYCRTGRQVWAHKNIP
jgi:hypothetical protein